MKKCISIILCVTVLFSLSTAVFANSCNDTMNQPQSMTVTGEAKQYIQTIPIYITYIQNWDEESAQMIKERSNADLNALALSYNGKENNAVYAEDGSNKLCIEKTEYSVYRVTENNIAATVVRPEFANIFNRIYELSKQGVNVNYVNIFLQESAKKANSGGDANDPSYWESICPQLCPPGGTNVYQGYKFLYLESSVNVDTTPIVAGNIGGMNWTSIVSKFTKLMADVKVNNTVYQAFSVAYESLSIVFSGFAPPYSVTYSASSGFLKTWVTGDLYMRTILISDNLNRVSGYAYYDWGHLESFRAKTKVDAKWPVSKTPGGTYIYETNVKTYSTWRTVSTPGYNGNTTLYANVVFLYENTMGYFRHIETVDVDGIIASII